MTWGDLMPGLAEKPGYEAMAASEYVPGRPPAAPAEGGPTAAEIREQRLLILGCDYRGGPALECGCTKTRVCLMGKGKPLPGTDAFDVSYEDCLACVAGKFPP